MSEGRTPTATLTEQRQLHPEDIDLLHQIILRAESDPGSVSAPKDALLRSYGEVVDERRTDARQDKACFNVLMSLLDPQLAGDSLYAKFETFLHQQGIELAFEDDPSTQVDDGSTYDRVSVAPKQLLDHLPRVIHPRSVSFTRAENSIEDFPKQDPVDDLDDHLDNPPLHIAQLMRVAEARDRMTLMRQTLELMQARHIAGLEDRADALYERRLLMRTLWHMANLFRLRHLAYQRAEEAYDAKIKHSALRKLSNEYSVGRVTAVNDERLKGFALYHMTIASRESAFRRQLDARLKHQFLLRLLHASQNSRTRQNGLEDMLSQHQARKGVQRVQPLIRLFTDHVRQANEMRSIADGHYSTTLASTSVKTWWSQADKIDKDIITADNMRERFLVQGLLNRLRRNVEAKRARRTVIIRWVLVRWKELLAKRKHERYDSAYKIIRRMVKVDLAQNAVKVWKVRINEIQAMEQLADEHYRQNLLKRVAHPAVITVYQTAMQATENAALADLHAKGLRKRRGLRALGGRMDKIEQMDNIAERFRSLKVQEIASQCLKQMQMKGFELDRRKEDAEAFRTRQDRLTLRAMLDAMRRKLAQQRGEPPLALPPSTPSRRRAEEMIRLSTTPLYTPAVVGFTARLRAEGNARETGRILEEVVEEE